MPTGRSAGGADPSPESRVHARMVPRALLALGLAGCDLSTPADTGGPLLATTPVLPERAALDDEALLVRASLDLRGVRPTTEELDLLRADPALYPVLVDEFLQDPRFPDRMVDTWDAVFHGRMDTFLADEMYPIDPEDVGLDDAATFYASVEGETTATIRRVIDEDLPWTELVTADWTMADATLDALWPVDRVDPKAAGHSLAVYTDGRPAAGLIASNSLWWRYRSGNINYNRARAAMTARFFLCHDLHALEVELDPTAVLVDGEDIRDAIATNPSCRACHDDLEPLSAYFFGFWVNDEERGQADIWAVYKEDREGWWEKSTGVAPSYYGDASVTDLALLGQAIATDERFGACLVQDAWRLLVGREPTVDDPLDELEDRLDEGGMALRPLVRAVVLSEDYRQAPLRLAAPGLVQSQVADLTGYLFTVDEVEQLWRGADGLRVLAGDADGHAVSAREEAPSVPAVLLQARLAEAAAAHVIAREEEGIPTGLFPACRVDEGVECKGFDAQLAGLAGRVLGPTPAAEELAELRALFEAGQRAGGSPQAGWTAVLAGLLRDPTLLLY